MGRLFCFLALIALLCPVGQAQTKLEATDLANHPFEADFPSGGQIRMHVRSGEIRILGSDDNKISVRLAGKNADCAKDLKVRLVRADNSANLRVSGGPRNELTIIIHVPKNTDLFARIPAGDVEVEGITGSKDVELHAGELRIAVGDAAGYAQVDASVLTGEVDADPFGESKGGLFRGFKKAGIGKYRLHAHVGAGQLTLR